MYSSPPRHGAEIAQLILSDSQLFAAWKVPCPPPPSVVGQCPLPHQFGDLRSLRAGTRGKVHM